LVVPELRLRLPQAGAGLPLIVKITESPAAGAPLRPFVTVAVTVDVAEPLAGTADGVAETVTMFGSQVCPP
jgi:hypothetical protein